MEHQRQEGNEEEAAAQLDELDQLRQGEQEATVANELDDSEPQRQEVQEEAIGIAEEDTEGAETEEGCGSCYLVFSASSLYCKHS